MAVPAVAMVALRYGAVALAGWAVARNIPQARRDQRVEDAMDELEEGAGLARDDDSLRGAWRFRRVVRAGRNGPGVDIDFSALARLRFKRVT